MRDRKQMVHAGLTVTLLTIALCMVPAQAAVVQIYSNNNPYGVTQNPGGPPNPTTIPIHFPTYVTQIDNFHWNYGAGASPAGAVALRRQSDAMLAGPWQAALHDQVVWRAQPMSLVPTGTYVVEDSGPDTWSYNAQSGNAGFTRIWADIDHTEHYDNFNIAGVSQNPSGPPNSTLFTTDRDYYITQVTNYHWNNGQGVPYWGGSISFRRISDGALFGPWFAWNHDLYTRRAQPYAFLPAGTYAVEDGEPGTWAYNMHSDYSGFSEIYVVVPEPATITLMGLGGLAVLRRRSRQAKTPLRRRRQRS